MISIEDDFLMKNSINSCTQVVIPKEKIEECWAFSRESAKSQQSFEFGVENSHHRPTDEIARDNMIGKLGEVAVQQLLSEFDIDVSLDMSIYEVGEWDRCDIEYRGWMLDVKCTQRGFNFLIEWNKLQFRADAHELPHFFVATRLSKDTSITFDGATSDCVKVDVIGYIDVRELAETNESIHVLKPGDCIPDTSTKVTAKNFCIPFSDNLKIKNDWAKLADQLKKDKPFDLSSYKAPGIIVAKNSPEIKSGKPSHEMKYSLLVSGEDSRQLSLASAQQLIESGIKLFVFGSSEQQKVFRSLGSKYDRSSFAFYRVDGQIPTLRIVDGVRDDHQQRTLEFLANQATNFNIEQYQVEHAGSSPAIIVKASAGTGKTTVMIDRIVYLLAMDASLEPGDIGMITFTNKATASMLEKLQKRLMSMYKITGNDRWYTLLEKLSDLQLSTIDSFFHDLISTEGSLLGYGRKASLRSLVYAKKQLIREILNDRFIKRTNGSGEISQSINILKENGLSIHKLVNLTLAIWDKLHARGYFGRDIVQCDLGIAGNDDSTPINNVLKEVLIEAEKRYQTLKLSLNAYGIDDIKAEVDALARKNPHSLHRSSLKYIFVDEFQDTDNSQICSLVWLQRITHCQLFVVGDIKQSIYRFRGAEESAFDELKIRLINENKLKNCEITTFILSRNYRTSANVINKLNVLFNKWANRDENLLIWDSNALANVRDTGHYSLIKSEYKEGNFGRYPKFVVSNLIKQAQYSSHICVLTRTNYQVRMVAQWCKEAGVQCQAKLDGGFYQSIPVRDLHALLGALLYSNDTRRLWNLFQTPYVSVRPDVDKVLKFEGDEKQISQYLRELLAKEGILKFESDAKYCAFFPLLESLLTGLNPIGRLKSILMANESDPEVLKYRIDSYQLNLNKLLQIIYEQFTGDFASLLSVFEFIDNKIQTDFPEDELYPEFSSNPSKTYIEAMTVHKAKGLEFETVFIPFTQTLFVPENASETPARVDVITDFVASRLRVGWSDGTHCNTYFKNNWSNEFTALRRDEARLLYVAMTRAKRNLMILVPEVPLENTWSEYLCY